MDDSLLSDLQAAYDADADRREGRTPDPWRYDLVDDLASRLFESGRRRVVDLGCGTGQFAARMAAADLEVTAIDLSPEHITRTEARGVAAHRASFDALPFPDGSFDGALAFNSFLHVPKDQLRSVITETHRVLVRGGIALIAVWGGIDQDGPDDADWLDPPRFFSFFSDETFLGLPTPGFRRLETRFLHEHTEDDGSSLHPQVVFLEAQ